jgi:hypothetical protein
VKSPKIKYTYSFIPFCEEFYYCEASDKGGRGVLAPPNILGFPFCLLKKYEPKENLLIGSPWNYYYYYYFFFMGKLFTIDVYFKGKTIQNWDDAFFKRKMCKIGRLMLNPLFLNTETLEVKPLKKAQSI